MAKISSHLDFTGDLDGLHKLTKDIGLSEKVLKKAEVTAINKSLTSLRAVAVKAVSRDYKVTQKAVRKELEIRRANYSRRNGRIIGAGSPGIPLSQFAPTPKRVPSTVQKNGRWNISTREMVPGSNKYLPKGGVKVMVRRKSRKMIRTAFVAKMFSGHVGVFQRTDKKGLPIKELFGPSPIRLLDNKKYAAELQKVSGELMDKNMAHEIDFQLKKAGVLTDA